KDGDGGVFYSSEEFCRDHLGYVRFPNGTNFWTAETVQEGKAYKGVLFAFGQRGCQEFIRVNDLEQQRGAYSIRCVRQ
ncbi:MAG: hypothetical protein ACRCZZ_01235, partial [Phocaeicola sp.]